MITRDFILNCEDIDYKVVDVPRWGDVRIKMLSIGDQLVFEKLNVDKKEESDLVFGMIVLCCVDENNNPLFTNDDIPLLKKKSSVSMLHLFNECLNLNGLRKDALDKQAKNS